MCSARGGPSKRINVVCTIPRRRRRLVEPLKIRSVVDGRVKALVVRGGRILITGIGRRTKRSAKHASTSAKLASFARQHCLRVRRRSGEKDARTRLQLVSVVDG